MRICHITSAHSRFDSRIFRKQCISLAKCGCDVYLVIADGLADEIIDGVKILGVKKKSNVLSRIFVSTSDVCRKALETNADIYHIHDPELLLQVRLLKNSGGRVIFDIHEKMTEQIKIKPYLNVLSGALLAKIYELYEAIALSQIDGVSAATEDLCESYKCKVRFSKAVQNFVDLSQYQTKKLDFSRPIIFHPGALTINRGVKVMVDVARMLGDNADLFLAGPLQKELLLADLRPAKYLGVIDEAELIRMYGVSNIGLILYKNIGQYGGATAVKLYEYMANCMPVILPDHGDWKILNESIGCGINVDVNNPAEVVTAVNWLVKNPAEAAAMGLRGRSHAEKYCSWEAAFGRLINLYESVSNHSFQMLQAAGGQRGKSCG